MAENSTFEEQWTLLRKETGMEDAPSGKSWNTLFSGNMAGWFWCIT